jgi:hypothetical protein
MVVGDRPQSHLGPPLADDTGTAADTGKAVVMDAGILKTDLKYDEIST